MKPLIVMPAVKNAHVTREAVDSVINHDVDIILCANGADQDIIDLFYQYKEMSPRVSVWIEPVNIGVNPIWNKFLDYFIGGNYTHIGIMNNDIILQRQWLDYLNQVDSKQVPVCIEVDKDKVKESIDLCQDTTTVTEGTNGIFIWLTKEQARIVYPIPEAIKIWFGDNWIHFKLRKAGYPTVIHHNLRAFHQGSVTIQSVDGVSEQIEKDKIEWEKIKFMI